jgi:hypothetical protein
MSTTCNFAYPENDTEDYNVTFTNLRKEFIYGEYKDYEHHVQVGKNDAKVILTPEENPDLSKVKKTTQSTLPKL